MKCYAALLDTRSVQRFIFAGNKLKTNIGASYLVDKAMSRLLVDVLNEPPFSFGIGYDDWKKDVADAGLRIEKNPDLPCEIAYIGGGNALVLFRENIAKDVVKKFTRRILIAVPGLGTGAAVGEVAIGEGEEKEQETIEALYKSLRANQNKILPAVNLPYTGLTVPDESLSGSVAGERSEGRYIAAETSAKLKAAKAANEALAASFAATQDGGYSFPDSLEDLGQKEGDEYFAIVHADGNDMGVKFSRCANLARRKKLSLAVAAASHRAFARLIDEVIVPACQGEYDDILDSKLFRRKFLPIRPLILGGDDITFVCPAKLALVYTKKLLEFLAAETLPVNDETVAFSACGGVAILPTKYPFFRGYKLAEDLCTSAKSAAREAKENDGSLSWLDFAILHGEQAPTLEELLRQEYTGAQGNLHFGPYAVAPLEEPHSIERLFVGAKEFHDNWPTSKIKGLRDVIRRGAADIKLFLQQIGRQGLCLPDIAGKLDRYKDTLWLDERTPYLDMIETQDFLHFPKNSEA